MNQQDLSQKLTPSRGALTIGHDTLDRAFGDFLDVYYGSVPIVISDAVLSADPQPDGTIVVSGKSTFANVPDLPVTAHFGVDASGAVTAELRYTLRGSLPTPNPWVFSRSFPKLPTEPNYLTGRDEVMLDALDLFDTSFVVTTAAMKDRGLDVPLSRGINFVSHLRPLGVLGVFRYMVRDKPSSVIYGVLIPPQQTDLVVAPRPFEHPWDRLGGASPPPPAGIYLQAPLDLDMKIGTIDLGAAFFRTYTPISTDWTAAHPDYGHLQGFTAKLSIPSAKIEIDLGADVKWGVPVALLYGNCSGVTLGKLEHLVDFAGTDGLIAHVPEALKKPIATLEKLELMQVGLDLVLSGGVPTLRTVSVTIGFPNLQWHVWADDVVVESLSARFVVYEPFTPRAPATGGAAAPSLPVSVAVNGVVDIEGVPLSIIAESDEGFMLRAMTEKPVAIPLAKLAQKHAKGVPQPSALTVNYLEIMIWEGQTYAMSALLAGDPKPWTIAVGKEALTISNVSLWFSKPVSGALSGAISGRIAFSEGVVLQVTYDIPGSFIIRSTLPPMRLGAVIDRLCNHPVKLPPGVDFEMSFTSILIQEQKEQGTFLFQLCTEIKGMGVLAFEARKTPSGTWGFAYGLELVAAQPSQVGGLTALAALEKALHLRKFLLVVSSLDQPGFQLPDSAQFNEPTLATKKVALPGAGGVTAGLNVFAEWALDGGDKHHKLLKSLLGLGDTLQVTIQVGENPSNAKLFFGESGKLQGHPFAYKLGVQLDNGAPSLFLEGSITVEIHKQPETFTLTTLFVPNGAFLSAAMKGTKPIDLGPFKIGNVGFEVGVDLAGLPSFGVTGNIDVKSFESSIAVFFDAANPAKSLIAGAVSNLTLKDVVDTMLGGITSSIDGVLSSVAIRGTHAFTLPGAVSDALDHLKLDAVAAAFATAAKIQLPSTSEQILLCVNKAGASWHLTDLSTMHHYQLEKSGQDIQVSLEAQLYFAAEQTFVASIPFPPGFFLNGAIEFLGWGAQATIDIVGITSNNRGVKVDAEMDKLSLGNGVFAITSADGKGGARVSISTMPDPSNPVAEFRTPHFYVDGGVALLGLKARMLASLTTKGLLIDVKGPLAPGVEFDLDLTLDKGSLAADGDIKLGIGVIDLGPLGKIKVNTDLEGQLGVRINGNQVAVAAEASFDFLGDEMKIGRFSIDSSPNALLHLADTMKDKVTARLRDEFKDADRWANAAKHGVVDGVNDTEKVMKDVFHKSDKEAKAVAGDIKSGAKDATKAVTKTASKFGKKIGKLF